MLHGAGREDIDARCVGTGRRSSLKSLPRKSVPWTLSPLKRKINRSADGRVAVALSHWSDRSDVETLKSSKAHKKYRILVEVEGPLSAEELANDLKALKGVTIQQRTPERVAHRRADKIRERKVLDIECVGVQDGQFILEVLGEAGLTSKNSYQEIREGPPRVLPRSCRDRRTSPVLMSCR